MLRRIHARYSGTSSTFADSRTIYLKQDCFLKKEAEGTLAALEFLIAWGERLAFALVKFSHIIMKEIRWSRVYQEVFYKVNIDFR